MNRIEQETKRLLDLAAAGKLPGYPVQNAEDSFYSVSPDCGDLTEWFSGENDALERLLTALWINDKQLKQCVPIVMAAVEKCRGREDSTVVHTELYNYTTI